MADFLLEIGCDEIPARMIDGAREELVRRVSELVLRERLSSQIEMESFSTPRRLAVLAKNLNARQPDLEEQVLGPATKVAYKDGTATPAAEAFARKVQLEVGQLRTVKNAKGEYLTATVLKKGRSAQDMLAESLPKEIAGIYWAKSMYWRAGKPERFVRPVRWIVALLDEKVVSFEFGGIRSGQSSRGHRILSAAEEQIGVPGEYERILDSAKVIANHKLREARIRKALDAATRAVPGARWREDAALLSTVVNLTEFPSVILGGFEEDYLGLPEEVLVTVMRDHQKYFAVEDAQGRLAPYFLAVLNTDGDPEGLIRHGNERVLRARFNDARFFWTTDQKTALRERVEKLKAVTFQKDLGSYFEKSERTVQIAAWIALELEHFGMTVDQGALKEAAQLAKTDLTTELVKEFTELQGIVGGLYAKAQGVSDNAASAIYDQYKPASVEDVIPKTLEGAVLSIADKADSVAGMLAIGLHPTGSKDPFALRRQANGIVKIIAERQLRLSLATLMRVALRQYQGSSAEKKFIAGPEFLAQTSAFFRERQEFYLREVRGFAYDEVNAVLAADAEDISDAVMRTQAVSQMRKSADFEAIATSFKRMKNILRQARDAGKNPAEQLDLSVLIDETEKQLAGAVTHAAALVKALVAKKNYADALAEIARLRPGIDAFFEKVMVMVEQERLRAARLALLREILQNFSTIADFSEIVTEGK